MRTGSGDDLRPISSKRATEILRREAWHVRIRRFVSCSSASRRGPSARRRADAYVRGVRDTIVIGASAGGIDAVSRLVSQLPGDLPASVLVALHLSPAAPSALPEIFCRRGTLAAVAPSPDGGEPLRASRIYVVRPDHHLVIEGDRARSSHGPRVNGRRPAIDVLFRSSARARTDRVIAVVLTGLLDDGVGGLREIRSRGGLSVVQAPADAAYPDLPTNAIEGAGADHVAAIDDMGPLLVRLVKDLAPDGGSSPSRKGEPGATGGVMPSHRTGPRQDWSSPTESPEGGAPSVYACPECSGVLWNTGPEDLPRFVCRVGHAYDPESLLAEQQVEAEKQTWAALRAVEERLSLARKLETRARTLGHSDAQERLARHVAEAERQAGVIRSALTLRGSSTRAPGTDPSRQAP